MNFTQITDLADYCVESQVRYKPLHMVHNGGNLIFILEVTFFFPLYLLDNLW